MKKLYEIEDFKNKKVYSGEVGDLYFFLEDETWYSDTQRDVSEYVGDNFFKPIWREYEEPNELVIKYQLCKVYQNKTTLSVFRTLDTYEEAEKAMYKMTDGWYIIRKVYVRE